jgi:purine nucleoside permease
MTKKYVVTSKAEEQAALNALTRKGKVAVRRLARANILRMALYRLKTPSVPV